ncbi:MAG: glycosyltransferase [Bacteroidales bacterium]|jgi:glycosyltransferase involved in cell wall biosynthesis|nr:glycosyltransferase [Bacteroidales bacterium]
MSHIPAVSVIVPVYNGEKTLEKCLESLRIQSFRDFEVIMIDDGSTDRSGSICDRYAAEDARFIVFHQQNSGVASARQLGTDKASGKYSIHADADDWIEPDMLEKMYKCAVTNDADILFTDYYLNNGSTQVYRSQRLQSIIPREVLIQLLKNQLEGFLWNKMVRHSLYDKFEIHYFPGIDLSEDTLIFAQLLQHELKLCYLPEAFYHYNTWASTLTKEWTESTFEKKLKFCNQLLEIVPSDLKEQTRSVLVRTGFTAWKKGLLSSKSFKSQFRPEFKQMKWMSLGRKDSIAFLLLILGMTGFAKCLK